MTTQNTALATQAQNDGQEETAGKAVETFRQYGTLSTPARQAFDRSRALRRIADQIGLTPVGANATPAGRVALAEWCLAVDANPLTDIDNVGGPYLNSEYYLRKLGECRTRGIVADVKQQHIGADARLAALAKDKEAPEDVRQQASAEHYRRLSLRIKHGVPEEAAAAHLTEIYLTNGGEPITGVKWGGNGTSVKQPKAGGGSSPNPVVENNPVLAVESQSVRRAMRQLAMKYPDALPNMEQADDSLGELRERFRAEATMAREDVEVLPVRGRPLAELTAGDEYGMPMEVVPPQKAATDEPDLSHLPFPEGLSLDDDGGR